MKACLPSKQTCCNTVSQCIKLKSWSNSLRRLSTKPIKLKLQLSVGPSVAVFGCILLSYAYVQSWHETSTCTRAVTVLHLPYKYTRADVGLPPSNYHCSIEPPKPCTLWCAQHKHFKVQICKDKKTTLLESMDKVKLSYSQLTAQTAELTQQVLHMTSHVRSQVCLLITSSDDSLDCVHQTAI